MKQKLLFYFPLTVLMALLYAIPARATVTVNATNFPDVNFRNAVAQAAGVSSDGGQFSEASLTRLDLPGMNVTTVKNLTGLELLTGLTYLDISGNTQLATGANVSTLNHLVTLKASNCNLASVNGTSGSSTHPGAGLTLGSNNSSIKYLDLSHNVNFYSSGNLKYLTGLETLLLNDCTGYDYWGADPGLGMSSLKWLDISNTVCDRIFLPNATNLKHMKASNTLLIGFNSNASTATPTAGYIHIPVNINTLEYLNLSNCSHLTSLRAIYKHYNVTSIDTLILANSTQLGWSNDGIERQTGMTYLDVTNCDISTAGPDYIPDFSNLNALETLYYGENPNVGYLDITGNSNLKTLDLHGDTGLTMLTLDNCGLPRTNLAINDTNCPALTGLKLNHNGYSSVSQAMSNATDWGLDNIKFLYLQNNSGFTGGALTMNADDCGGLTGIDLGNNGFTSFSAPELPASLTALMLGDNPSMKRLEMHNNPGITTMTNNPVMTDGSGLYLLGNTGLTYMDISGTAEQPNYFQRIGNNSSLEGVPIDTLKASHNQFYTFRNLNTVSTREGWETYHKTNLVYGWKDFDINQPNNGQPDPSTYYYGVWHPSPAQPDSASLEHLTNLKYLDLSYCHLKDSVYLHKNRELLYLDVSHNRKINRHYEQQYPDKGAAYRAYVDPEGWIDKRNFEDYKLYLWLTDPNSTGLEPYTGDYNDTIALYNLDLVYNNKLEYLDISYTGIEQTAANHCYVPNPRFIWIQDLPNLKYFYADYNGMRSLGLTTKNGRYYREGLKSLERLSVIGMRGADNKTMQGSTNYGSIDPNKTSRPSPLINLHYINLSYSSYDSIGIYNEMVDTLIIRGNPIHYLNVDSLPLITYVDARECAFKMRGYDDEYGRTYPPDVNTFMNGARVGGSYNSGSTNNFPPTQSDIDNLHPVRSPFSGLRGVLATHRPELTTLLLDSCNALTNVYAHDDPKLPKIHGFEHLAYPKPEVDAQYSYSADADSLRLVWVNDNLVFNELNLTQNVNLQYLHAYNDHALGDALSDAGMMLNTNDKLVTAWVSNSNLRAFANSAGANLDTLKIWTNPMLAELNVSDNTGLKWLDLRNCRVSTLDMSNCGVLTHFDCSNDSVPGTRDNGFGYDIPEAVPNYVGEPGKNSINELHFAGTSLKHVKADNNDLYRMDGLKNNSQLDTLTYANNHINAIDLSGTNGISIYDADHNGRGRFFGEMSRWKVKEGNDTIVYSMYYLQLKPNAGDGLDGNDTFLGNRCGQDSLRSMADRGLSADGFDPEMVEQFTVNSAGPYFGTRPGSFNAPRRGTSYEDLDSGTIPVDTLTIGTVAVLDHMTDDGNYIVYNYKDGRTSTSTTPYYLVWVPTSVPTEQEETLADNLGEATVVSERYYDIDGRELSEPVSGVNIIVRQMSDGSMQTVKVLK